MIRVMIRTMMNNDLIPTQQAYYQLIMWGIWYNTVDHLKEKLYCIDIEIPLPNAKLNSKIHKNCNLLKWSLIHIIHDLYNMIHD